MPASNLTRKDLKAILDIVSTMNDASDEEPLPSEVLAGIGRLIGCEAIHYARAELITGRVVIPLAEPHGSNVSRKPGWQAVVHQHPGLVAYQTGRVRLDTSTALSDVIDHRALRRLPIWVDFHEPYGFADQLMHPSSDGGGWISGVVCNRSRRGFSDRDRAAMDLVSGHVSQAMTRRRRVVTLVATARSLSRNGERVDVALSRLPMLTPRERHVVEHVAAGLTDRETARSLAISPRTVHKHLENVYRKLRLTNRTSLVATVHGTLDPEGSISSSGPLHDHTVRRAEGAGCGHEPCRGPRGDESATLRPRVGTTAK